MGRFKRMLYEFSHARKLALLRQRIVTKDSIWDRLVFQKIQVLKESIIFKLKNQIQIILQIQIQCFKGSTWRKRSLYRHRISSNQC